MKPPRLNREPSPLETWPQKLIRHTNCRDGESGPQKLSRRPALLEVPGRPLQSCFVVAETPTYATACRRT